MTSDPVPRSLVGVDIEGYSGRDNQGQAELRKKLREVCDEVSPRLAMTAATARRAQPLDAVARVHDLPAVRVRGYVPGITAIPPGPTRSADSTPSGYLPERDRMTRHAG